MPGMDWMKRKLFKPCQLIALLLFFCPFMSIWAVGVSNLYKVTVPVASQLSDQRDFAESEGFLKVLIKLTGDADIAKNPVIKGSIHRAEYYVRDYHYSSPTPSSSEYMIEIQYDRDDIIRLLKKSGVPFWEDARPLTLAWIAVNAKNKQTEIIGSDSQNQIHYLIKTAGKQLGVALIFPVMDMDDLGQIDEREVLMQDLPELKKASKRYSPDILLIAQLNDDGTSVTGQWNLVMNADEWEWNITGKSMHEMIDRAMGQISQTIVRQYHVNSDAKYQQPYWIKVIVTNVQGNGDLNQLMSYLKRLAPVEKMQLAQVSGSGVEFYLLVNGSIEGFLKNASTGRRLLLKASDETAKKITYQWVR